MSEVIDRFKKNAVEEIRASLTEFSGHKLLDSRTWTQNKAIDLVPTKKGILGCELSYFRPSEGPWSALRGF